MDSVEELLKKHEDFEKLLAGQEERFTQLNRETEVTVHYMLTYVHIYMHCMGAHVSKSMYVQYVCMCLDKCL